MTERPLGSDPCYCGDYRSQHVDGIGRCRTCAGSIAPWDGCQRFQFTRRATVEEQAHWEKFHGAKAKDAAKAG
jgi:hypothetical protein